MYFVVKSSDHFNRRLHRYAQIKPLSSSRPFASLRGYPGLTAEMLAYEVGVIRTFMRSR